MRILSCILLFSVLLVPIAAQEDTKITTIEVLPDKVDLKPGDSYRFIARGYNRAYQEVRFVPEWSCTGGTIDAQGFYVAGPSEGVHSVNATFPRTGAQGSAVVVIKRVREPQPLPVPATTVASRLVLLPSNIVLSPGETIRFEVRAYNMYNQELRLPYYSWQITGGSMTSDGLYKAGGSPGTYQIRVQDPSTGISGEAVVTIRGVRGQLASMKIFPSDARVAPYKEKRFFATGYDASANVVPVTPRWEANGGNIDINGIYVAGPIPGTYFIRAISPEGITSTATVVIEDLEITRVQIIPDRATLLPGQIVKFQLTVYDRAGNVVNAFPLWNATGGIMQSNGTYQAGSVPGDYVITVSVGKLTTPPIPIKILTPVNRPVRLEILPSNAILKPRQQILFLAKAYNAKGEEVRVPVTWTVRGGILEPNGVFQAGTIEGTYMIEASTEELTAKTMVTIRPDAPEIVSLRITPEEIRLQPGGMVQFIAVAFDRMNKPVPCNLSWSAEGGDLSKEGVYTAGRQPGEFFVQVSTDSGIKALAKVIILGLEPPEPPMPPGPVIPPGPVVTIPSSEFLHLIRWKTGHGDDVDGQILIQGRVLSDQGHKVQLVIENTDGTEQIISQVTVIRGQRFEFTGKYYRATTRAIKLLLVDQHGKRLYEFRRET